MLNEQEIQGELSQANEKLKKTFELSSLSMAFPAGLYNSQVQKVAKSLNYDFIFTTEEGRYSASHSTQLVPRYNINDEFVSSPMGGYSLAHFIWNLWRRESF